MLDPARGWGSNVSTQRFPFGLREDKISGKILLAENSAESQCILVASPDLASPRQNASASSGHIAFEHCNSAQDPSKPGIYILKLDDTLMTTCRDSEFCGWDPDATADAIYKEGCCNVDDDLVVTEWTSMQELLRTRVKPAENSKWNFSLNEFRDIHVKSGQIVVGARNVKDPNNHSLVFLEARQDQASEVKWVYEDPLDQNPRTFDDQPLPPCFYREGMGFAPDTSNLWVGMCEVMDSYQFGTDKTIMLDINAQAVVYSIEEGNRYSHHCSFLGPGTNNELECIPGGDCFHEDLCIRRDKGYLSTPKNKGGNVSALYKLTGALDCGGTNFDMDYSCDIAGDSFPETDVVVERAAGYFPNEIGNFYCNVSLASFSRPRDNRILVAGKIVNGSHSLKQCTELPEIATISQNNNINMVVLALTMPPMTRGAVGTRQIDVFEWTSGPEHARRVSSFDFKSDPRTEKLAMLPTAPFVPRTLNNDIGAQLTMDGQTLLFWAVDNSTVQVPLENICVKQKKISDALALVVLDTHKSSVLGVKRYDLDCDEPPPLLKSSQAAPSRAYVVANGRLDAFELGRAGSLTSNQQ